MYNNNKYIILIRVVINDLQTLKCEGTFCINHFS